MPKVKTHQGTAKRIKKTKPQPSHPLREGKRVQVLPEGEDLGGAKNILV